MAALDSPDGNSGVADVRPSKAAARRSVRHGARAGCGKSPLALLASVSREAAFVQSRADMERVFGLTVDCLAGALQLRSCALFVLDDRSDVLACRSAVPHVGQDDSPLLAAPAGNLFRALVKRCPPVFLLRDLDVGPERIGRWLAAVLARFGSDALAALVAPSGKPAGLLVLARGSPESAWQVSEEETAEAFADQVAVAIERLRWAEELAILSAATGGASAESRLFLTNVLAQSLRALELPAGLILLRRKEKDDLALGAAQGIPEMLLAGDGVPGTIQQISACLGSLPNGQAVWVEDSVAEHAPHARFLAACSFRAMGAVPLGADGSEGIFCVFDVNPRLFTRQERRLLALLARQVGVAVANNRLYLQQRQGLHEQRSLRAILRRITTHLDLEATLPEITRSAVELLDAAAGVLVLWDPEHQVYRDTAVYNLPREAAEQPVAKSENISIGAFTIEHGGPVIVDDYTNDPRSVPMLRPFGFKATLSVPLVSQDGAIGALIVLSTNPAKKYSEHDVELLSAFADQATVAIENALLYAKERERVRQIVIAQEQERRKIARELHDEICQALLNLLMESSLYERDTAAPEARAWLREHTAGLRQTLELTRGVLADLRNVALETLGLLGAIETELLPRWRRGTSCEVMFEQREWPPDLPFDLSLQIYRVLQEALNNVKKHACASEVRILLERRESKLTLTVTDDGVGFDPTAEADRADGWVRVGLEGMRERAGLLSAQLEVLSHPGAGTEVRLSVPYPQRPASAAEPSDPLDVCAANP